MKSIPVFCLGPEGSHGHEAAKKALLILGMQMPETSFEIIFATDNVAILEEAVAQNAIAIIPVENGRKGIVPEVMEWRSEQGSRSLWIVGEIIIDIHQHLTALPGTKKEDLVAVCSHPHALGQCRHNIRELGLETIEVKSTSLAAAEVSKGKHGQYTGAIASPEAATMYGLESYGEFADAEGNQTLFHICAPWKVPPTGNDRTVIMYELPNEIGSEYEAAGIFVCHGINLTSKHSITLGKLNQYAFYVDAEMHEDTELGRKVIEELKQKARNVRILGSFPKANVIAEQVSKLPKMTVAVIGASGCMGKSITTFLRVRGLEVLEVDVDTKLILVDALLGAEMIIVAVPIRGLGKVMGTVLGFALKGSLVIILSSVMNTGNEHWIQDEKPIAWIHFMASMRGLSFGKRAAYVAENTSCTHSVWHEVLPILVDEMEAVMHRVVPNFHDQSRLSDQTSQAVLSFLWARMIMALHHDPARFDEGVSPMTSLGYGIMAKNVLLSDLYGSVVMENAFVHDLVLRMIGELQMLASIVKRHDYEKLTSKYKEIIKELGEETIKRLMLENESHLSRM